MTPLQRPDVDRICRARDAILICCSPRAVSDATSKFPGQRVIYVGEEYCHFAEYVMGGQYFRPVQSFPTTEALRQNFTTATMRSPNVVILDASPEQREAIEQMCLTTTANRAAAYDRGRDWVRGLIANLPMLSVYASASSVKGCLRGVPALLVGPGPSLDRNRDQIERMRGHALIVGCNSATRAVRCDVAVCVESHDLRHKLDPDAPVAALALTCHPDVWAHMRGLKAPVANGELGRIVAELTETPAVPSSATVSTSALSLLSHWGCSPIVLVGHDLAVTDDGRNYSHAAGGGMLPELELTDVRGWQGGTVKSIATYDGVRQFFADRAGRDRWNCTEGGSSIPGWREVGLGEWIESWRARELMPRPPTDPVWTLRQALRESERTPPERIAAWGRQHIEACELLAEVAVKYRGGLLLAQTLQWCPLLEAWCAREVLELASARWSEEIGWDEAAVASEHAEVLAGILARGALELADELHRLAL